MKFLLSADQNFLCWQHTSCILILWYDSSWFLWALLCSESFVVGFDQSSSLSFGRTCLIISHTQKKGIKFWKEEEEIEEKESSWHEFLFVKLTNKQFFGDPLINSSYVPGEFLCYISKTKRELKTLNFHVWLSAVSCVKHAL